MWFWQFAFMYVFFSTVACIRVWCVQNKSFSLASLLTLSMTACIVVSRLNQLQWLWITFDSKNTVKKLFRIHALLIWLLMGLSRCNQNWFHTNTQTTELWHKYCLEATRSLYSEQCGELEDLGTGKLWVARSHIGHWKWCHLIDHVIWLSISYQY